MDVPFGSILASILVCIGVGAFCGTCQIAILETADMFDAELTSDEFEQRAQDFFFPMQISVYSVTGLMVFMAIVFVFVGFMATAQSKRQVYEDDRVPCGGRCCTSLALFLGYLLMFLWLVINGALLLPIIFTLMVARYQDFLQDNNYDVDCIDLAYYGFTNTGNINTTICGEDNLKEFGKKANSAFLFYIIAYGGSVLVTIGLLHFLMCFSANWGHLKDGLKRRDYEAKRHEEEQELEEINGGYRHDNHHHHHHQSRSGPAVMRAESFEMRPGGGGVGRMQLPPLPQAHAAHTDRGSPVNGYY